MVGDNKYMINKKKKNGFTLIELLAVIIILAVIMTVAIPNIVGTLEKNKKDSFLQDAKRSITSCEYTIRSEKKYEYPDEETAIIFPINKIKNLNLEVSTYDTYYSQDDSFVAITKDKVGSGQTYEYTYYVHLVSCTDENCENIDDNSSLKNRGINLTYSNMLDTTSKYDLVVKGDEVILNYLRDTTDNYGNLRSALQQIRKENPYNSITTDEDAIISNIIIY